MMGKPFSPSQYGDDISGLPTDLIESEIKRLENRPILQRFVTLQKIAILKSEIEYRKRFKVNE